MKRALWIVIATGVFLVILGAVGYFFTIRDRVVVTHGIDAFEFHRPVFGRYTQSQDIILTRPLEGIGALIVNFRRAPVIPDPTLTISDQKNGQVLHTTTLPSDQIQSDRLINVVFPTPIGQAGQHIRVTFSAPTASGDNPLAIRYHPDDVYPAGESWSNEQPATGDLAVAALQRVSLWQYFATNLFQHVTQLKFLSLAIAIAGLVTLLTLRAGWSHVPALHQHHVEIAVLIAISLLALYGRVLTVPKFHGVSGGDPYNYLAIAQKVTRGQNPLAEEKRLPGYPVLLIPAYLTAIDDQWWMRLIATTSAAGVVLAIGLLARQLGLPWSVQVLAACLVAWQKDFWWNSFRPEPYTVFAFLLVSTLALLVRVRRPWQLYIAGVLLGLSAMTRQEGFVVAAVLTLSVLVLGPRLLVWQEAQPPVRGRGWQLTLQQCVKARLPFWRLFIPAFLIVLPFFIHNAIAYGDPFFTPYFEGDRLQIVDSWPAFLDSAGATWGVLGSMWLSAWDMLQRVDWVHPVFLATIIVLAGGWLVAQKIPQAGLRFLQAAQIILGAALLGVLMWLYVYQSSSLLTAVAVAAAGALAVSSLPFLFMTGRVGLMIWMVLLSQLLVATWFHPFPKHYQQSYPLLLLMLATALLIDSEGSKTETKRTGRVVTFAATFLSRIALITPLVMCILTLHGSLIHEIDEYNQDTAFDHVTYQAVMTARDLPRPVGFDEGYSQARLYFAEDDHAYFYYEGERSLPAQETAWINQWNIKTLVVTDNNTAFLEIDPRWQLLYSFKAEGKRERIYESRIYALP